jgi:hypothetical protein
MVTHTGAPHATIVTASATSKTDRMQSRLGISLLAKIAQQHSHFWRDKQVRRLDQKDRQRHRWLRRRS